MKRSSAEQIKLPVGSEEKFVVERNNMVVFVGHYKNGDPKNRITLKLIGNTDPTRDIVFAVILRDNKLYLQYPLFFDLQKMASMLEIIRDNEKPIIEAGKEIWK